MCSHTRTEIDHVFDNACDEYCNVCSAKRKAPHSYDNGEDLICNDCGHERPPYIIGDCNGDYKIDTTDLASLKLFLAAISDLSDTGKLGADLNGDGNVDTTDLATLKLKLAGIE